MSLTKVKATMLGLVHLVKTCAARRSREDVAGKAATPKNARHRQRTADKDFVANIFFASCARRLVRAEREYTSLQEISFGLASL